MGYPIEYSGARVKELLAKANETEIRVNGWQKLASSFRDPVNLNALLSLGNFYCVYAINCPSSIVNSGPYNISVSRIDLMTYQIIDCRGALLQLAFTWEGSGFLLNLGICSECQSMILTELRLISMDMWIRSLRTPIWVLHQQILKIM